MDNDRQSAGREMVQILKDAFLGAAMGDYTMTAQQRRQEALLRMLLTNQEPVQWVAIKELGQIGDLAAADAVMPFTTSPNRDLQDAARTAYRQIQEREGARAQAATPPPPPPPTRKAAAPPAPPPAPAVAAPKPQPKVPAAPVVEAHMGRSRDTRMTKGQDLPVPPTETQLGQMKPQAEIAPLSMGALLSELPVPAGIPEPVSAMPEMEPASATLPEVPAMAEIPGGVVNYSVLGIPMGRG